MIIVQHESLTYMEILPKETDQLRNVSRNRKFNL